MQSGSSVCRCTGLPVVVVASVYRTPPSENAKGHTVKSTAGSAVAVQAVL